MSAIRRIRHYIAATGSAINSASPTGLFLKDLDPHRIDAYKPRMLSGRDYEFASVDVGFNLRPISDNAVVLQSLYSADTGNGDGTKALSIICEVADRNRVTIHIDVQPFSHKGAASMPKEKLKQWYSKFGFYPTGPLEMQRDPR